MGWENEVVLIRRLCEAMVDTHYANTAATGLTTAYAHIAVTNTSGGAELVPEADCRLSSMQILMSNPAGLSAVGTANIQWYLSYDQNGTQAITPTIQSVIQFQAADPVINSNPGSVVALIDLPYLRPSTLGTNGTIYLQARLDAGTCTVTANLFFVAKTPLPVA